jgi:superfamily II DNA or RNA helicase
MSDLFDWGERNFAAESGSSAATEGGDVPYFRRFYDRLSYPIGQDGKIGFRAAQIAAIQAANSHLYSKPTLPAIVVMPTGSGKTAVMNALAFTQRAQRVLVLTPSRLVREQIAEGFGTLSDLREVGAFPQDLPNPKCFSTRGRVGSDQAWEDLRAYDVVVATVPSVAPKDSVVPAPPPDLFDLILVDEAHHSPAATWKATLDAFSDTRRVHFTATPFRTDEREIAGRVVFVYDIRRAYFDGVFGEIEYEPVEPTVGQDPDVAIALAAQKRLRQDQAAGLKHLLMVRTDSRARANDLKKVYESTTDLKLRLVAGNQTLKYVRGVVDELRTLKLDGVICVNMLAEGFNLPNLKVAAVHAPHRSLAVTLQFIGRFARTTGRELGAATFLAVPSEIRIETTKLFRQDAVWREIVHNLSASRVEAEVRTREYLDSFEPQAVPDFAGFSLYALRPYYHAKILSVPDGVDLTLEVEMPSGLEAVYRGHSVEHRSVVYVARERWLPPWSGDERLENVAYEMFLLHHNAAAGLLFICSTRRQSSVYDLFAASVSLGRTRLVSLHRLNRVLNGLEGIELFNLGMRNRTTLGNAESYRTLAGPAADRAVQPSDGRLYDRGHCFGRATADGDVITIGLSSASKIWSNTTSPIPEFIEWCDGLAEKISKGRTPVTHTGIDYLSAGEEASELPDDLQIALWDKEVYLESPSVRYLDNDGSVLIAELLDFDLRVRASNADSYLLTLSNGASEFEVLFGFDSDRYFSAVDGKALDFWIIENRSDLPLLDFLNDVPVSFYTSNLSRLEGNSMFPAPENLIPFEPKNFEAVDWVGENVAIEREKPHAGDDKLSIFEWLESRLVSSDASVVYCDDGSGEMADYISIRQTDGELTRVTLYHCKGAGGAEAGDRVGDAYVVCGQAIKSLVWTRPRVMLDRIIWRLARTPPSKFAKGGVADAVAALGDERPQNVEIEIVIVQPGFRKELSAKLAGLLASANDYLVHGGALPLKVIGSD